MSENDDHHPPVDPRWNRERKHPKRRNRKKEQPKADPVLMKYWRDKMYEDYIFPLRTTPLSVHLTQCLVVKRNKT